MDIKYVVVMELDEAEVAHLRKMYNGGWATDIERKLYEYVSSMTYGAREDSVNNFLLTQQQHT